MGYDFDPKRLKADDSQMSSVGVRRLLTTLPVRKPNNEAFVRTHPSKDYQLFTTVLELKRSQEFYLVDPAMRDHLSRETTCGPRLLITSIERDGTLFVWPLKLPDADTSHLWYSSALEAADMAAKEWTRVQSNKTLEAYEFHPAEGSIPEPTWPEMKFSDLLAVAFKDRVITSPDHPVLLRLRGGV